MGPGGAYVFSQARAPAKRACVERCYTFALHRESVSLVGMGVFSAPCMVGLSLHAQDTSEMDKDAKMWHKANGLG